jgi:hypothetical protein
MAMSHMLLASALAALCFLLRFVSCVRFCPGPWSALRSSTYGWGRMLIHNATHMEFTQYLDEGRAGTDHWWIKKKAREALKGEQDEAGVDEANNPTIALQ